MTLHFKESNVFYEDFGKGSAVVLLHGFLENSTMWKELIPHLTKRNRVITIDLLGHGKTDSLGYIHTMEDMAEAVFTVLKSLRLRKIKIVGHSLGGYVALALTEKHPQMIKSICLMNSTSVEDSPERKTLRLRANKMIQNNFENVVRMSFSNLFGEKNRNLYKEEMKSALREALKTPIQGYIAGQEGMRIRTNRTAILTENEFKKLIIIGEKDPVLNLESSLKEAKRTNSEVVVFPEGHMSHIENAAALYRALRYFVDIN